MVNFRIADVAPPDLSTYPQDVRKLFWGFVVKWGLKRKSQEILEGLDRHGNPMGISPYTRKHRKSMMTASGKGDPGAPALVPGWQKSRTYALLAGRAHTNNAEFYWRYDAYTGESWGEVLKDQAAKGRDTLGLSPAGTAWVKLRAWRDWERWRKSRGTSAEQPAGTELGRAAQEHPAAAALGAGALPSIPNVGRRGFDKATMGMGIGGGTPDVAGGRFTGGMTPSEWRAYFSRSAPAELPGRPARPPGGYNKLIQIVWGKPGARPAQLGLPGVIPKATIPALPRIKPPPWAEIKPAAPARPPRPPSSPTARPPILPPMPRKSFAPAAGTPIADLYDLQNAPHLAQVRIALNAINKVHGVGPGAGARIPVASMPAGLQAASGFEVMDNRPFAIGMAARGKNASMQFAHEVGHHIEQFLIPGHREGQRDWMTDPLMQEWLNAARGSKAYTALLELKAAIFKGDAQGDVRFLDLMTSPAELWSRSYAQWIAMRSGNAEMVDQLRRMQSPPGASVYPSAQWAEEDFRPIAEALDKLFRAIGWRQ